MPAVDVRLERSDTPNSAALQEEFFEYIQERYPGWEPWMISSADPDEVAAPDGAWVVAYIDGEAVGCAGLKRLDATTGEVKRVYLQPSARGHGLGRGLMEALEYHGRRLGFERLRLDTGDRQPEALGLFRALGYREIEDYNRNPFASYWMEKAL
jgi:GNAT superfamily N-acetyltransferase